MYSLSEFRDLLFHIQEHQFNKEDLKGAFERLNLSFCGFENKIAVDRFVNEHNGLSEKFNLQKWAKFEQKYPDSFSSMYQFWCQKNIRNKQFFGQTIHLLFASLFELIFNFNTFLFDT